jgi:hypothetical protein
MCDLEAATTSASSPSARPGHTPVVRRGSQELLLPAHADKASSSSSSSCDWKYVYGEVV